MKNIVKKLKGKKVLSLLLALVMVLSVASPAFSPIMGIIAKAATGDTIELAFDNIFVFEEWANHQSFAALNTDASLLEDAITVDMQNGSFTLTNPNAVSSVNVEVFTSFSMATADTHYTIPVEANTTYNFSYNLSGTIGSVDVFIFYYDTDGKYFELNSSSATESGDKSFVFTTPENTGYIGVRFDNNTGNSSVTFKDIKICKSTTVEGTVDGNKIPNRKTYTAGTGYYTDLPVPTKDGWFFMGWYTGENGSGELVTADTEVFGSSVTVYSMWEADVTSLSIDTEPTKNSYTLGEKVDTTGLVLQGTLAGGSTITIDSGFRCSPENVDTVGTQTITVNYGTKSVTFDVNVVSHIDKTVTVDGTEQTVPVANNTYTLNHTAAEAFNRYELTYTSDSYVKGTITMGNVSEDFFLEPSDDGSFASYIDNFLTGTTQTGIATIKFTCLNKANGSFELLSVATDYIAAPDSEMQYYENGEYKVGIDLGMGGTLSYLQDLINKPIAVDYSGTTGTKVDFEDNITDIADAEGVDRDVNLINTFDKGRLVQQSYYGTDKYPFDLGSYDGNDWRYNPVQGGNAPVYADDDKTVLRGDEASKIVDYEITETEIYVKTRPLDWGKNSEDYPDSYNTPSYMESRYVFEDGMIKTYCRFVDYSGYPSSVYKQELPAFYCVEPLNYFAYSTGGDAWSSANKITYKTDLEYWGKNGVNPNFNCNENWAAFMAGNSDDSYGIGVYSANVSNFVAGVFPDIKTDYIVNDPNIANNHAKTIDPSSEVYTSYMAPSENMKFKSYSPFEYAYYITTGTAKQIRADFQTLAGVVVPEEIKECTISVPETIYMTPTDGAATQGQYYVNNIMDSDGNITLANDSADTTGYIAIHAPGMTAFEFSVSIAGQNDSSATFSFENSSFTTEYMASAGCGDTKGYIFYDGVNLESVASGLNPGTTALAEWKFKLTYSDGSVITNYAYSTLYAPNYHSVGATAEARYNTSNRVDGAGWISGIHTVNTSLAPFGKNSGVDGQGVFKSEPLLDLSKPITPQDWGSANNLTSSSDGLVYAREYYKSSEGGSNEQSPTGILYVDYSRYKNTNTIPNVYVGSELLKADSGNNSDTHMYAYYTLGTGTEFVNPGDSDTPSGWTQYVTLSSSSGYHNGTVASTLSSGTDMTNFVSILKDANSGRSLRIYTRPSLTIQESGTQYIYLHNQIRKNDSRYANMYVAVQIVTCNKSTLRALVLECTGLNEANYTTTSWANFKTDLQNAAQALGNPSNSDVTTTYDALIAARDALQTNVYLNPNGGTITPTSFGVTIGNGTTASADVSAYIPTRTGYTFTGWTAIEGATIGGTTETINVGFNQTLYAVWKANKYNVTFDNLFDLSQFKDKIATNEVVVNELTDTGFTIEAISATKKDSNGNDIFNNDCNPQWTYNITLEPNTTYIFSADVTHTDNTSIGANCYEIFAGVKLSDGSLDANCTVGENCKKEGNYIKATNDGTFSFTTSSDSVYVSFRFDVNDYQSVMTVENIRLWKDDGTTVSPVNKYAEYGSVYGNLPTPVKDGRGFKGWQNKATGDMVDESTIMNVTETVNLKSEWEAIHYTINFNENGAEGVKIPNICLSAGNTTFVLPQGPVCEDLEFLGWSTDQFATKAEYKAGQTINVNSLNFTEDENNTGGVVTTIHAVWKLKSSVVVNDTVIADFGQPVTISPYQMNDAGIFLYHAGSMCDGYSVVFADGTKNFNGIYGTFSVDENGYTITYTPTSVMQGVDTAEIKATLIYKNTGAKQEFTSTITVVPASNMLYEEDNFITYGDGQTYKAWTKEDKSSYEAKLYDKNTGLYNDQNLINATPEEVHGYNGKYEGNYGFSDGSYSKITVTADNSGTTVKENMSDVATFTFTGTGFDLISACGTNTGIQLIKVKDSSDKLVNSYIIDTYLSDTSYMTTGDEGALLHQVPILTFRTETHGEYTVEVTAAYLSFAQALKHTGTAAVSFASAPVVAGNGVEVVTTTSTASSDLIKELEEMGVDMGDDVQLIWMDDNSVLNGGTGATEIATTVPKNGLLSGYAQQYLSSSVTSLANYIDGFRVYNPLNGGAPVYDGETEQNNTYYNIVEEIGKTYSNNFKIIESGDVDFDFTSEAFKAFDYNSFRTNGGPKGEIYLKPGQAIAFTFTASTDGTPSKVMLGMRAVNGSAKAGVCTTNSIGTPYEKTVNSATEMYYDVSEAGTVNNGVVTMAIANTGNTGVLAVNSLKLVDGTVSSQGEVVVNGSNDVVGGSSSVPEAVLPVAPVVPGDAENNAPENSNPEGNLPENGTTEPTTPETDGDTEADTENNTEDDTQNNVSTMFPGMPAPVASFLEMLLKLISQLFGSFGF